MFRARSVGMTQLDASPLNRQHNVMPDCVSAVQYLLGRLTVKSTWSQDNFFPAIAHAIERLSAGQPQNAAHDAIVARLLRDPEALPQIDAACTGEPADRESEWPTTWSRGQPTHHGRRFTMGQSLRTRMRRRQTGVSSCKVTLTEVARGVSAVVWPHKA